MPALLPVDFLLNAGWNTSRLRGYRTYLLKLWGGVVTSSKTSYEIMKNRKSRTRRRAENSRGNRGHAPMTERRSDRIHDRIAYFLFAAHCGRHSDQRRMRASCVFVHIWRRGRISRTQHRHNYRTVRDIYGSATAVRDTQIILIFFNSYLPQSICRQYIVNI